MRSLFFKIMGLCLAMGLFSSCTGHKDVVREMESYQPPSLYQVQKEKTDLSQVQTENLPQVSSEADEAFNAHKKRMEELKKDWATAVFSPKEGPLFFEPDPDRQKTLAQALADDKAAGAVLSDGFSLEDFEILVFGRNPDLKNAEKIFLATLESYGQASVLDDIIRSYAAFNAGIMTGVGNMEEMESINRKYPFPGILSLKGDIVSQEVRIAFLDLEIARRSVLTEARRTYFERAYNVKARHTAQKTLNILETLEASVTRQYETGRSRIPDLTRVKIQKEKMKVEVLSLFEEGLSIEKRIKAFVFLPASVNIGIPDLKAIEKPLLTISGITEAETEKTALTHNQDIKKLEAMITRMELMIEMAETEIYPGAVPNLAFTENRAVLSSGSMKMEEPFAVTAAASSGSGLPRMPWTGLSEAYLRETRQRLLALREELKGKQSGIASAVRDAWFQMDRAGREALVFEKEIDSISKLNVSGTLREYETGEALFPETMDTVLLVFDTSLSASRKKADFYIALADLYKTAGASKETIKKEKDKSHAH